MKEKLNMSLFMAAGLGDIATTSFALSQGYKEAWILGPFVEKYNLTGALIFRMAVTAVVIGGYALTKERNGRFAYSFDKALRLGNVFYWGILAINTLQLAAGGRPDVLGF